MAVTRLAVGDQSRLVLDFGFCLTLIKDGLSSVAESVERFRRSRSGSAALRSGVHATRRIGKFLVTNGLWLGATQVVGPLAVEQVVTLGGSCFGFFMELAPGEGLRVDALVGLLLGEHSGVEGDRGSALVAG